MTSTTATGAAGMALRVIGRAAIIGAVDDEPKGVVVYGHELDRQELRWVVEGMSAVRVHDLDRPGPYGEYNEIVGAILGRTYRLHLRQHRLPEVADLLGAPEVTE